MKTIPVRSPLIVLLGTVMLLGGNASGQQGFQLGASYYPLDNVIGVNATMPMFTSQDVHHSARAGVTYAFTGRPAVAATYLLSDAREQPYSTYIGAGVGLAFPDPPASSPSVSGHAIAGVNVHITRNFSAFTEVTVAGNALGSRLRVGAGLTYTFGGNN